MLLDQRWAVSANIVSLTKSFKIAQNRLKAAASTWFRWIDDLLIVFRFLSAFILHRELPITVRKSID